MASSAPSHDELGSSKQAIRIAAHAAREEQADKAGASRRITDTVLSLSEYQAAGCVMWYVDVRSEARTRHVLPDALSSDKTIVIPFCVGDHLELFHLESMEELSTGRYDILEPKETLRDVQQKRVRLEQLDLILVPGVAFDRLGGRLGHGKGYYDRLLQKTRPDTLLIALAFDCQIVDDIPLQSHDISMDQVVTPSAVYTGRGRHRS